MNTVVAPRTVRAESPQRWAAALDRAIAQALDVYISTAGEGFVESASQPGLLYEVSRESCSCLAGRNGQPCKHRACYLAQIGELDLTSRILDTTSARITFTGGSDRQEIRIDGRYFGIAAYADDAGWTLFQGKFPHAKSRGTYCTLDELERDLAAQLPARLPIPSVAPVADLAIAHAA